MDETIYDLCIVGAGMFGSAAARHASANVGFRVCLVGPDEPTTEEMKSCEIFGAHYDEGRITRILDESIPSQILARQSIKRYRELEELSGIQFYHPVGCMCVREKNSPHLRQLLQMANIENLPVVDLSYGDILKRRFPFLNMKSGDHPLLDDMGAGHISPRNMVAAQKKVARLQGCRIINAVVNEVTPMVDGIHEIKIEKGMVLKSNRVLICTGAFTNQKTFPIPKLKMNINKETVALLKIPIEEAERLSSMPSISYYRPEDDKLGYYILPPIQYPNGFYYLKIGHLNFEDSDRKVKDLEEIKNWYLSNGDPQKIQNMSNLLISMLPGLKYEEITGLTCVTSANPSGEPFIDRVSPTVTVAVIGNGKGAKMCDEIGRIAAHLSLTGKWDSELNQNHFKIIVDGE